MNHTQQLAEFAADLTYDDLSDEAVEAAKVAIRDALGVALFSAPLEWTEKVADFAQASSGAGPCGIWGKGWRLAAPYAAMVNATSAHGIEMDDRSGALDLHNGCVTVPAAIAAIEHAGGTGRDLLAAIVAGYEVAYRVARATQGGITRFYFVSIRSIFGAATASARALSLDAEQTRNTLGVVGSMASGLLEHTQDPLGTMVKRLQGGGWPSHAGVTAALLASRGFTGPRQILEGKHGVCNAFCTDAEPDLDALSADLGGQPYEILAWETKPYAAVGHLHSSIDAVKALTGEHAIDPERITEIEIGCSTKILPNTGAARPESVMAGQRMLEFVVAASFFAELGDPAVWTDDLVADERVVSLAAKVRPNVLDEIEEIYQQTNDHGGVDMTIHLEDGQRLRKRIRHAKGTIDNPMTDGELRTKFRSLARRSLDEQEVLQLEEYVDGLDDLDGPVDFGSLCTTRA